MEPRFSSSLISFRSFGLGRLSSNTSHNMAMLCRGFSFIGVTNLLEFFNGD